MWWQHAAPVWLRNNGYHQQNGIFLLFLSSESQSSRVETSAVLRVALVCVVGRQDICIYVRLNPECTLRCHCVSAGWRRTDGTTWHRRPHRKNYSTQDARALSQTHAHSAVLQMVWVKNKTKSSQMFYQEAAGTRCCLSFDPSLCLCLLVLSSQGRPGRKGNTGEPGLEGLKVGPLSVDGVILTLKLAKRQEEIEMLWNMIRKKRKNKKTNSMSLETAEEFGGVLEKSPTFITKLRCSSQNFKVFFFNSPSVGLWVMNSQCGLFCPSRPSCFTTIYLIFI